VQTKINVTLDIEHTSQTVQPNRQEQKSYLYT